MQTNNPSKLLSQTDKGKKFKGRRARFIENMADPSIKTQKEAYIAAGYSDKGADQSASKLLTNTEIRAAIEKRKAEVAQFTGVTPEFLIGAAVRQATTTVDDVLDEHGHFSIDRARETGAVHLIKSLTRSQNKYGETVRFELYSADEARQELAHYIGLKQLAEQNDEKFKRAVMALSAYLEDHPDADREHVFKVFARGSGFTIEELKAQFANEGDQN